MGLLGSRRNTGVISTDNTNPYGNGFWMVEFNPQRLAIASGSAEVYHIYLEGPSSSRFRMFVNTTPYSAAARGDLNDWDPNIPLEFRGGNSIFFYWNKAATPAPLVVLYLRTPTRV